MQGIGSLPDKDSADEVVSCWNSFLDLQNIQGVLQFVQNIVQRRAQSWIRSKKLELHLTSIRIRLTSRKVRRIQITEESLSKNISLCFHFFFISHFDRNSIFQTTISFFLTIRWKRSIFGDARETNALFTGEKYKNSRRWKKKKNAGLYKYFLWNT